MDFSIKLFNGKKIKDSFQTYVLGIDIGGTNTNIGIAGIENSKTFLLFSLNFKSQQLNSIIPAINKTLKYCSEKYNILPEFACIGAAGAVSPDNNFVELTNLDWNVDSKNIIRETEIKYVHIINDFQSIGFGLNLLDENNSNDILTIRSQIQDVTNTKSTKVIIGAGTGLGKSILTYNNHFKAYIPIASEGGHTDFPVQNDFEMGLVNFIKEFRGISQPITYEEILSGRGLESIYYYLRRSKKYEETKYTCEIDEASDKAPLISKYKDTDEACKQTFVLFTKYYARCAKNFVLDTLARGGIYIAGGIASKNKEIFSSDVFISEFKNAYRKNVILEKVPIKIIVNYDVSLFGACYAAFYKFIDNR